MLTQARAVRNMYNMTVGWDADDNDNGDGHLDAPAEDPTLPVTDNEPDYRQEAAAMVWDIQSKRQERSGMWQAVAVGTTPELPDAAPYRQVSSLWSTREAAETEVRLLVDYFERQLGIEPEPAPRLSPADVILRGVRR